MTDDDLWPASPWGDAYDDLIDRAEKGGAVTVVEIDDLLETAPSRPLSEKRHLEDLRRSLIIEGPDVPYRQRRGKSFDALRRMYDVFGCGDDADLPADIPLGERGFGVA